MQSIPLAVVSKAHVFGLLIAGIPVSNPAEGMDVLLFFIVCCVGSGLSTNWSLVPWRPIERECVYVSNCVWSRNLKNIAAYAWVGV
jgi:hypothetical protein